MHAATWQHLTIEPQKFRNPEVPKSQCTVVINYRTAKVKDTEFTDKKIAGLEVCV